MGLFKKRTTDPEELDRLKGEIAAMASRLEATEAAKGELDSRLQGIQSRLDAPTPAPLEPPAPMPTIDPAELDKINARIARLTDRVDGDDAVAGDDTPPVDTAHVEELTAQMQRITDRIDELDQRITSISTELANQITELGGDVDAVRGNEPATDEVVGELRDAQTRLASEQARYQIAFRQDLAELADRLKRA